MLCIPERLEGIVHPLISDMYIKHDFHGAETESVLVIKANSRANHWFDLMADLRGISFMAEQKYGHFDRVDIVAAQ